jgi:hypothetical protein
MRITGGYKKFVKWFTFFKYANENMKVKLSGQSSAEPDPYYWICSSVPVTIISKFFLIGGQ